MKTNRSFADGEPMAPDDGAATRRIGVLVVDPALRRVHGPAGDCSIEPRVLDVLLLLASAQGRVVSRAALTEQCWAARVVGEDAVNRAIGEVRRVMRVCAANSLEVQTIPKSGWRLLVHEAPVVETALPAEAAAQDAAVGSTALLAAPTATLMPTQPLPQPQPTRRFWLLGLAGTAAAAASAVGIWPLLPASRQLAAPADAAGENATQLVADADRKLMLGELAATREGIALLNQAVRVVPTHALAWGRLALAWREMALYGPPAEGAHAVALSDRSTRQALALDPAQTDALAAAALLPPIYGHWSSGETRLRAVLAAAPQQHEAMSGLGTLLKSVGRDGDSAALARAVAALVPLSPLYAYRNAYGLWTSGQVAAADRELDRAAQMFPRHTGVWSTQLLLLAMTDRVPAARAMLDDSAQRPAYVGEPLQQLFARSFDAIESRAPAAVAEATLLHEAAARAGPGGAIRAILFLSHLDQLDSAFAVAEGYYLRRGALAGAVWRSDGLPSVNEFNERKTMVLFVPPTAPMRADPRFEALCESIGLAAYWRGAGVEPDYRRAAGISAAARPRG